MRDTLAERQPFRVLSSRSVESPEPVMKGGDPDAGVTGGQAFDRVWDRHAVTAVYLGGL